MPVTFAQKPLPLAGAVLASLLTAVLCALALHQIVGHLTRKEQFEELGNTSRISAQVANRTRHTLVELSRELDLPAQPDGCSPALQQRLQDTLLRTPGGRALVRIQEQSVACASAATLDGLHVGPPSHIREDGLQTWYSITLPGDPTRQPYLLLGFNGLGVLILPSEQFALIGGKHVALAVYEARHPPQVSYNSGMIPADWLIALPRPGQAHSIDPATGTLRVYHRRAESQAMTLATIDASHVQALADTRFRQALPLVLFPALIAGLLVLLLWRRPLSPRRALEKALAGNGLFLVYQPVVDMASQRIVGAESLIRWRTDDGRILTPDLFLPLAESLGLSSRITGKVCQRLREDIPSILRQQPDFMIGLNIAAPELSDNRLADNMLALQQALALGPGQLVVELTESSLVDAEQALPAINRMRQAGIQIAIDDFGTGYCGLSYLASIPFDILKIDRAFVNAAGTDSVIGPIAQHVVTLSHILGVAALAEGIETAEQSEHFRQLGVRYAQGYFHGRPMSVRALEQLLGDQPQ